MAATADLVLAATGYLLFKHTIADFFLQTGYQVSNKLKYGHPGGILHALIHVVLTLPVFLILPANAVTIGSIAVVEFLIHYHVDYVKECIVHRYAWKADDAHFWWAIGVDQLLHNTAYIGMVGYLSR